MRQTRRFVLAMAAAAVMAFDCGAAEWFAGGGIKAVRDITADETAASVTLEAGVEFAPKWGAGLSAGYEYSRRSHLTCHMAEFSPYVRFVFLRSGRVDLFVDGGVVAATGSSRYDRVGPADRAWRFGAGVSPGVMLRLNGHMRLSARIGEAGWSRCNDAATVCGSAGGGGFALRPSSVSFLLYVVI